MNQATDIWGELENPPDADALKVYADDPHGAMAYVERLMELERDE